MLGKIDASLNDKLNEVKWGEFKLKEFLNWQPQKEIDPLQLDKLYDKNESLYPFYGQATANNGIISYERLSRKVLNNIDGCPTILIHSNNQNVVYLETPFYLKDGHGATSVLQCKNLNHKNQMFIISAILKVIKEKYSYNQKATKIELKNTVVKLPVNDKNKINFDFMDKFIDRLHACHLSKVKEYLFDTGLNNYKLTQVEKTIFDDIDWSEFCLKNLFDSYTGNFDIQKNHINNKGNYVITAGLTNFGILGKSDVSAKIFNKNTITIDMFGSAFYRNFEYKMVTHARVFSIKPKFEMTYKQGLFFESSLFFLNNIFGYENMCSWEKIKNYKIKLPSKDGKIDFDSMETLISAIQKFVVKDVVKYCDKKS